MFKSLEKLQKGYFSEYPCYENAHPQFQHDRAEHLADEIQAEIDKFYLLRPLDENDEPAEFGKEYLAFDGKALELDGLTIGADGAFTAFFVGHCGQTYRPGDRLKCKLEPDTQEKIDEDSILTAPEYCEKYGIECDEVVRGFEKCRHLLARQRKLDGVE